MPITYTLTPNPLAITSPFSFGVQTFSSLVTVKANNGTANFADFYNQIRSAYPANRSHSDFNNLIVVGYRPTGVVTPNSCYEFAVDYAQVESGTIPDNATNTSALITQYVRVESYTPDFYQEQCEVDKFGKGITNSAGDPYNPAGYTDRARVVVVLSWWALGFDSAKWLPMQGKLNDAPAIIPGMGACATRSVRVVFVKPAGPGQYRTCRIRFPATQRPQKP